MVTNDVGAWVDYMQAMLAFVPCLIWRFVSKRSGVNMAAIMDAARHCSQAHYLEIREKAIRYVVNQMDRYLLAQREYRTGCMVRIKHIVAKFCCVVGGEIQSFQRVHYRSNNCV